MTELEKMIADKLFDKLVGIYKNRDFVVGVMSNVPNTEDRQTIIDFIDQGEDVTVENIIALSVILDDMREKPRIIKK